MTSRSVQVYVLTGFLGSGKTSVLLKALEHFRQTGRKAAVLMNEFGDADVDGQLIDSGTAVESILGGCICCTVRGDIGLTVRELCSRHQPDVLLVEATGAADTADIVEGITDASFLAETELRAVVAVVDALLLADESARPRGKLLNLMRSQVRTAGWIVLSKTDLASSAQIECAARLIGKWNPHAPLLKAVRGEGGLDFIRGDRVVVQRGNSTEHTGNPGSRHDFLSVMTVQLDGAIGRERLEEVARTAGKGLYRMKGIARLAETPDLFLIQYAYGQLQILPIRPQKDVREVLVLIGEMEKLGEARDRLGLL